MKLAEFNVGTGRDDLDGPIPLLRRFNRTRTPFPKDMTVPGLFAGKAAETPDASAVTGGDVSLSYGALDRRSAQFAHFLLAQGLQPETLVGIMLGAAPSWITRTSGSRRSGA
jgi:non-ribosomal peptide synthetase component F